MLLLFFLREVQYVDCLVRFTSFHYLMCLCQIDTRLPLPHLIFVSCLTAPPYFYRPHLITCCHCCSPSLRIYLYTFPLLPDIVAHYPPHKLSLALIVPFLISYSLDHYLSQTILSPLSVASILSLFQPLCFPSSLSIV